MSAAADAADAATTNWKTYDGAVPQKFMFYAVFFPVLMAVFLALPAGVCYFCLSRGRVTPYSPPNMVGGGLDRKGPHHGSVNHGSVAEK